MSATRCRQLPIAAAKMCEVTLRHLLRQSARNVASRELHCHPSAHRNPGDGRFSAPCRVWQCVLRANQSNQTTEGTMQKSIAAMFGMAMVAMVFAPPAISKDTKPGGSASMMPAGDIKWNDVPDFAGVKMAVLEGNHEKGPHHSMLKLPGGFTAPLHHHTSDHFVTVVSGTLVLTVDGKDAKLPRGFVLFIQREETARHQV